MPSQMEFEGKDLEIAIKNASKNLSIPADKLKYSVISYGSTGIFGLVGAKKARIRVTVPDSAPNKPKKVRTPPPSDQKDIPKDNPDPEITAAPPPIEIAAEIEPDITTPPLDKTPSPPDEAALQAGKDALQQIVDTITTGASISIETDPEHTLFNISGGNSAILIGKRGQTLDAMQYLVEKIVNRQNDDRIRVQVDIEDYLKNRKNNLIQLAGRLAEKVKHTGKAASAGQMNAHDRRIVHVALKDDMAVRTQSIGEGLYRKLMIFPKKNTQKKKST
ncbi:MAG: Jag N-terminal domain-containing protein [Desulfobacterales bacterium]|nr:Jag N-terminal domain-containing protein [Desulfobacterales bacterium]